MEVVCKIVAIGGSGVGKSSMLRRYTDGDFLSNYISTIGVDFKVKCLRIKDKTVRMHLWDSGGQERFRAIVASYYRGAHAILLIYDITNHKSFLELENWLEEIKKYSNNKPLIYIIGNKCDLERNRVVSKQIAEDFATRHNFSFIETSAKSGQNIDYIFTQVANDVLEEFGDDVKPSAVSPLVIRSVPVYGRERRERKCSC